MSEITENTSTVDKLRHLNTARTIIIGEGWTVDGKSASIKLPNTTAEDKAVAREVVAELQRRVTGWTPKKEELDNGQTVRITTKSNYLTAAKDAIGREKQ